MQQRTKNMPIKSKTVSFYFSMKKNRITTNTHPVAKIEEIIPVFIPPSIAY
jgi:hypothetical protein